VDSHSSAMRVTAHL